MLPAAVLSWEVLMARLLLTDLPVHHLVLWNSILISAIVSFLSSPVLDSVISGISPLLIFLFYSGAISRNVKIIIQKRYWWLLLWWWQNSVSSACVLRNLHLFDLCVCVCVRMYVCVSMLAFAIIHSTTSLFSFLPASCPAGQAWCEIVTESVKCLKSIQDMP